MSFGGGEGLRRGSEEGEEGEEGEEDDARFFAGRAVGAGREVVAVERMHPPGLPPPSPKLRRAAAVATGCAHNDEGVDFHPAPSPLEPVGVGVGIGVDEGAGAGVPVSMARRAATDA